MKNLIIAALLIIICVFAYDACAAPADSFCEWSRHIGAVSTPEYLSRCGG